MADGRSWRVAALGPGGERGGHRADMMLAAPLTATLAGRRVSLVKRLRKLRASAVCLVVGFVAMRALGQPGSDATLPDWILMTLAGYFFGLLVLLAAVALLVLAGFDVSAATTRNDEAANKTPP
jgi:hypothetical protein